MRKMLVKSSELIFLLVFISFSATVCNSTEFVPVYMWETQNKVQPSPVLQKISESSFRETLLEKLKNNPLIVTFAEETLSPEDFAQHDENGKTPFTSLHKYLESANVAYKPYVQNPIGAVRQLDRPVTEISIASLLRNFNVPKDDVLVVDLNDAKDDEQRNDMLRRHDAAISKVFEKLLETNDNILAIYTAHHTSWITPEAIKGRNARSLLQEQNGTSEEPMKEADEEKIIQESSPVEKQIVKKDENGTLITDEKQFLMYVSSPALESVDKGKTWNPVDLKTVNYKADNNSINFTLSGGANTYNFKFALQSDGYWMLSNVTSSNSNFTIPDISAPFGFSYHCFNETLKSTDGKQILKLPGLQLEAFPNEKKDQVFGDPYDCVGFTSIPIWTGILVTVILLLILTFGITLMMDIRTMDKFDDAKGKTITINAAE